MVVMKLPLPEEARIGDSDQPATWYLKIGRPSINGVPGEVFLSCGLVAKENLKADEAFSPMALLKEDGVLLYGDGERYGEVYASPLDTDTYYELWFVMDHPRNTFDLHVRGGKQFPDITRVAKNARYRAQTSETLDYLVLTTTPGSAAGAPSGKDPGYLDDFYLFPQGERLETPGADWILLDDFEDGDTDGWDVRVEVW
jgi:hypothetical protein